MYRENTDSTATKKQPHVVLTALSFFTCFFFIFLAPASQANTNAKGVHLEFLIDSEIDDTLYNLNNTENQEQLLSLDQSLETIPFDNNIWLRIQAGYAMPDITSKHTTKFENWYASRPEYMEAMISRSEKYLFYVVEEVEKRGMPTEIALLPMIESAYNPKAYSRSHAAGIWQFIPSTGKHFGLKQNWWVDNRRHVTEATQAALDYLQKLHTMFGSWDLALAAYNAGEGTVGRAIAKNQKAGLPTDYQSLKLPIETEQYVPKLQAIKNIVTQPAQYGLTITTIVNQPYFAEIDPPHQIDAKLAAELAEITDEEFALLNPSYNRPVVASKNNAHKLLLPVSAIDTFQTNLNSYDDSLISWKVYQAKSGEYIRNIAKKFNISTSKLIEINGLHKNQRISTNLSLLVPNQSSQVNTINVAKLADQKTKNERIASSTVTHRIKPGETLSTLARKYGTNTKALMKINRLKSTRIRAGQILKVNGKTRRDKTKKI
jgi:peptidoglycan lytic transglycosylase D